MVSRERLRKNSRRPGPSVGSLAALSVCSSGESCGSSFAALSSLGFSSLGFSSFGFSLGDVSLTGGAGALSWAETVHPDRTPASKTMIEVRSKRYMRGLPHGSRLRSVVAIILTRHEARGEKQLRAARPARTATVSVSPEDKTRQRHCF